jgi:hypothetical protein
MFERLVVGKSPQTMATRLSAAPISGWASYPPGYSSGELAEALVFYDRVFLTGFAKELAELVHRVGAGPFHRLCEAGFVRIRFVRPKSDQLWIGDEVIFSPEEFAEFRSADSHTRATEAFEKVLISYGEHKRSVERLVRFVAADDGTWDGPEELLERHTSYKLLAQQARQSVGFLSDIVRTYLLHDAPNARLPDPLVRLADDGSFRVCGIHATAPTLVTEEIMVTPAGTAGARDHMLNILDQLAFGISLKAEFGSDPALAAAITHVVDRGTKFARPAEQISQFQERRFNNARAIANTIESRERTFDDLVDLLAKKRRFSVWLRGQELDQDLFDAFMGEMCAGSWIERATPKSLRFLLFTGAGIVADAVTAAATGVPGIGTAAGVALGAFDNFVVGKLSERWNPHQFVNVALASFVSPHT